MSSALPAGDPAPDDGALPPSVLTGARDRALGVYLHVPFCSVRCGYCDFNTYTARELGGGGDQAAYARTAVREVAFAAGVLRYCGLPRRPVATVYIGGGTPTLLPVTDLALLLSAVRGELGLAADAEVTTESNPDSVSAADLVALAEAGFTRVSFGMQSALPHVLATLERTHDPARIRPVVRWARQAGLSVSLDLIYGTPGESLDDWRVSLECALECAPDHVSAYALVVEDGTRLAAQVRKGLVGPVDDDDQAAKYELADDVLSRAGYRWYEVSNWAARPQGACRHNLGYWRGDDWWGVGPGAHSHVGGVRWWNVRHPARYAARVAAGASPAAGREVVAHEARRLERVMLGLRLSEGLPTRELSGSGRASVPDLVSQGLLVATAAGAGRAVLTRRGRLLADLVVRRLTA